MTDTCPTAHEITNATRASLRLVNSITGLLTLSQLLAMESELRITLAFVQSGIQAQLSGAFSENIPRPLADHSCFTEPPGVTTNSTGNNSTGTDSTDHDNHPSESESESEEEGKHEGTTTANIQSSAGE